MKNLVRYLQVIPATLLVVACANEKDPVADLPAIRQKAAESDLRAKNPPPAPKPVTEYVVRTETKVKPVEVIKHVDRPVEVIKLVDRIDSKSLVITNPEAITFGEGTPGSIDIGVRCIIPECVPTLTAGELPEGAKFEKANSTEPQSAAYKLTWTPKLGVTNASAGFLHGSINIKAGATLKNATMNEALKNYDFSKKLGYLVIRAPIVVKDVTIVGLPAEVQEGGQASFSVTAHISGIDPQTLDKPTIRAISTASITMPGGPAEIGGGTFIADSQAGEHAGNSVWKFNVKFDAKDFVVPKRGTGDIARAGFKFEVCMKGMCSESKTSKINIKFTKPTAAPVGNK